jgi:hypothetical protein
MEDPGHSCDASEDTGPGEHQPHTCYAKVPRLLCPLVDDRARQQVLGWLGDACDEWVPISISFS